jgi:alcohol dehydrogenase class IV
MGSEPTFEFATATRILFGAGVRRELPAIAGRYGRRVLIVSGRSPDRAEPVAAALRAAGLSCVKWTVPGEPSVAQAIEGRDLARASRCDVVLSIGGGSVIDAGKAVAALAANPGDPLDYLEVIGNGQALERPGLPFIAVPTTAGSGAEVTRNAVLTAAEHGVKVSLRSPLMLPTAAVVDPELTFGLPPDVTAATGLDALAQLIEPYLSARSSPLIDPWCVDGIARVARSLPIAVRRGDAADARSDMAFASLLGGLALANAALGAVHGFAGPIGGRFKAPHGAVCAALLPHVLRVNVDALGSRSPDGDRLARADRVAQLLTGRLDARAADGVAHLDALRRDLGIPGLAAHGLRAQDVPDLVAQARRSSSMRGNPIELTDDELADILSSAI